MGNIENIAAVGARGCQAYADASRIVFFSGLARRAADLNGRLRRIGGYIVQSRGRKAYVEFSSRILYLEKEAKNPSFPHIFSYYDGHADKIDRELRSIEAEKGSKKIRKGAFFEKRI